MVACELGDRFVNALVQQVFVAFEPVLNIVRTVEFERFAVGTVLLEQEIRADVVQQTANDHQMLVDEPRRNGTSGQPFRGRHRRHVQHAERFLAGIVFRQFQPEVAGFFGSVRRQGAAAGEQRVLPAGHAAGDVGHDHAMAVDKVVCGLRLRDFAM